MPLTEKGAFELYPLVVDEVHQYHDLHQRRVSFFLGFVASVLAATVAGMINSSEWFHYLMLLVGPLVISGLCWVGDDSVSRTYRLLMETVTVRAKFEQVLGLTDPPAKDLIKTGERYWIKERFVPTRHYQGRVDFSSSADWLDQYLNKGFELWTHRLFLGGHSIAAALAAVLVLMAELETRIAIVLLAGILLGYFWLMRSLRKTQTSM